MKVMEPPAARALGLPALAAKARRARRRAHAPFSGFKVGAALRGTRTVTLGANVEAATYGLTVCAERVAVWKAVTDAKRVTPPCGACRQVLWELCGDIWVHVANTRGQSRTMRLSELLPLPFDRRNL